MENIWSSRDASETGRRRRNLPDVIPLHIYTSRAISSRVFSFSVIVPLYWGPVSIVKWKPCTCPRISYWQRGEESNHGLFRSVMTGAAIDAALLWFVLPPVTPVNRDSEMVGKNVKREQLLPLFIIAYVIFFLLKQGIICVFFWYSLVANPRTLFTWANSISQIFLVLWQLIFGT